jgi:hypothetical protein
MATRRLPLDRLPPTWQSFLAWMFLLAVVLAGLFIWYTGVKLML